MDGGYWELPTKSLNAVDSEGWMHTGDLAVIDSCGFASIIGRLKELIICGGGSRPRRPVLTWLVPYG